MIVRVSILLFLLVTSVGAFAQDKMFTQAYVHPVDLNPSFSGNIDGKYRVTIAYRNQWKSFIESQFSTFALYGDIRINQDRKDDFFGAGFSVVADRTALFNANQNMINLYGSFHKSLSRGGTKYLSGGLSFGIAQRNLNYENIFFNDEFNGLDDYTLGTGENLPANNFAFMDLGLGVGYTSAFGDYSNFSIGIAVDHITGASVSFFHRAIDIEEPYPDARLDRKFTVHAGAELASNQYISLLPRLYYQRQGPLQMIAAAAIVKFDITNYDNQALHLGGGIRMNQTATSGLSPSAAYLMAGYEAGAFLIGLSHDINLSKLAAQSPGRGAFELSISFTGFYDNEESMCPTF